MLEDLLEKEFRHLWLGAETPASDSTPSYGQALPSRPTDGADDLSASILRNRRYIWSSSRDVLATARTASGM
jgi:hypothetical protein